MKLIFLICVSWLVSQVESTCKVSCSCNQTGVTLGYYWRDYFGEIPFDAVPGGKDLKGNPTYIGQVYTKEFELLPATIYAGCLTVTASAYNKRLEVNKNIKILCSNEQNKLAWITTKNEETPTLTNCHLVVGGSEVGQTLNIGRVNHDGQVVVGKIFSYPLGNRGLWIPSNNHEAHFLIYEILVYNCTQSYILDVRSQ